MYDPIETITSEHFTAELYQDDDCGDPFIEWDQVGILTTREFMDAKHASRDDAERAYYRLGLSINDYRSSGYGVSWERIPPGFRPQEQLDEYDAIIYTTRTRAEQMHSGPKTTPAQIWEALESEAETWKQWLNGECYGVVIVDKDGATVDSCWGFLGYDDPLEPARQMLADAEQDHALELVQLATTGGWVQI